MLFRSQRFLKITHPEGVFTIIGSWLPKETDLDEIYMILLERVYPEKQGGNEIRCKTMAYVEVGKN